MRSQRKGRSLRPSASALAATPSPASGHPVDLLLGSGGDPELNRILRKSFTERGAPVKWVEPAAATAHDLVAPLRRRAVWVAVALAGGHELGCKWR